jgi:acyl dehydratase
MEDRSLPAGAALRRDPALQALLDDSREWLGRAAPDLAPGAAIADWTNISRHVVATGDDNPLYIDLKHGADSWWRSTLAPPGFVLGVLVPESAGALRQRPHQVVDLLARVDLWWNDHIKLGDRVDARACLAAADWGPVLDRRETLALTTRATYRAHERAVAGATGVVRLHPLALGSELISARPIHRYSDAEIDHLERRLDAEAPARGARPRLYSETAPGEPLPSLVRGPVTWSELITWRVAEGRPAPAGNLRARQLREQPGGAHPHGATGWPFADRAQAREDLAGCADVGFATPCARPAMSVALAAQMVTRWMGDDAFLRHLSVALDEPLLYGDTLLLHGRVARKFIQELGGRRLHAVLLELWGHNQLEQPVFRGQAIVFLPEKGHPIQLPLDNEVY